MVYGKGYYRADIEGRFRHYQHILYLQDFDVHRLCFLKQAHIGDMLAMWS